MTSAVMKMARRMSRILGGASRFAPPIRADDLSCVSCVCRGGCASHARPSAAASSMNFWRMASMRSSMFRRSLSQVGERQFGDVVFVKVGDLRCHVQVLLWLRRSASAWTSKY